MLDTPYFDYSCFRITWLTGCRKFPAKTGYCVKKKKKKKKNFSVSHFVGPVDCLTACPHVTNFVDCSRNASIVSLCEI